MMIKQARRERPIRRWRCDLTMQALMVASGVSVNPNLYFGFHFYDAYQSRTPADVTGKTWTPGGCLINNPSAPTDTIVSGISGHVDNISGNFAIDLMAGANAYDFDFIGDFSVTCNLSVSKENTAGYAIVLSQATGGNIRVNLSNITVSGAKYWNVYSDSGTPTSPQTINTQCATDNLTAAGHSTVFPLAPSFSLELRWTAATQLVTVIHNGVSVTTQKAASSWPLSGRSPTVNPPWFFGHKTGNLLTGLAYSAGSVSGQRSKAGLTELAGFGRWLLMAGMSLPASYSGFSIGSGQQFTFHVRIRVLGDRAGSIGTTRTVWAKDGWYFGYITTSTGGVGFRFFDGLVIVAASTTSASIGSNYDVMVTKAADLKLRIFVNGNLINTSSASAGVATSGACFVGGSPGDTLSNYNNWPCCAITDFYMRSICERTASYSVPTVPFPDT